MPAGPLRPARFVTVPSYHIAWNLREPTEAEVRLKASKLGVPPEDVRRTVKVVVPDTPRGHAYCTWFWTSPWHRLYYRLMACCSGHQPVEPHLMDQAELSRTFGPDAVPISSMTLYVEGHPPFAHLLEIWHRVTDPAELDRGDIQTTSSRPWETWVAATRASVPARRAVRPAGPRP